MNEIDELRLLTSLCLTCYDRLSRSDRDFLTGLEVHINAVQFDLTVLFFCTLVVRSCLKDERAHLSKLSSSPCTITMCKYEYSDALPN